MAEPSDYTRGAFLSPFRDPSSLKNWKKYLLLPPQKAVSSAEVLHQLAVPVHILANRNDLELLAILERGKAWRDKLRVIP